MNGSLDGDSIGEITCIANDGASTVDYGIVNTRLFHKINSFEIIQRVESDHFPICCTLRISHGLPLDPTNSNVHLQPLTRFNYSSRGGGGGGGRNISGKYTKRRNRYKIEFFI